MITHTYTCTIIINQSSIPSPWGSLGHHRWFCNQFSPFFPVCRRGMPDRERKRVPADRSDILKGSLPTSPPAHPWDMENLGIWGWTKRMGRRIEMKQLRQVWRSCTRERHTRHTHIHTHKLHAMAHTTCICTHKAYTCTYTHEHLCMYAHMHTHTQTTHTHTILQP